jgi:hypothetical protein
VLKCRFLLFCDCYTNCYCLIVTPIFLSNQRRSLFSKKKDRLSPLRSSIFFLSRSWPDPFSPGPRTLSLNLSLPHPLRLPLSPPRIAVASLSLLTCTEVSHPPPSPPGPPLVEALLSRNSITEVSRA